MKIKLWDVQEITIINGTCKPSLQVQIQFNLNNRCGRCGCIESAPKFVVKHGRKTARTELGWDDPFAEFKPY